MDFFIPKTRPGTGTVMRGERRPRFWQSKATGTVVEVTRYLRDVDRDQFRVVFYDPDLKQELNMPFEKPEPHPFQPPGAKEVLMERPFTEKYHVYMDQRSVRA